MKYVRFLFIGFCMGAADIVPGVSGGTMALILGIYKRLVSAVSTISHLDTLKVFFAGHFAKFWKLVDGTFLASLACGILLAVALLSHILESALEAYPMYIWALFFGLVLGSTVLIARKVRWTLRDMFLFLPCVIFAYSIVGASAVSTPDSWWFLILSGSIAICAMILPGISGSFILVLLGKYQFILEAVNNRNLGSIALVGIGAILGLLLFSHVLHWLLKRYYNSVLICLVGFMLGSVRHIWPWKSEVGVLTSGNVFPVMSPQTALVIFCMMLGLALVIALDYISQKLDS